MKQKILNALNDVDDILKALNKVLASLTRTIARIKHNTYFPVMCRDCSCALAPLAPSNITLIAMRYNNHRRCIMSEQLQSALAFLVLVIAVAIIAAL